jgi:hypothetical protein
VLHCRSMFAARCFTLSTSSSSLHSRVDPESGICNLDCGFTDNDMLKSSGWSGHAEDSGEIRMVTSAKGSPIPSFIQQCTRAGERQFAHWRGRNPFLQGKTWLGPHVVFWISSSTHWNCHIYMAWCLGISDYLGAVPIIQGSANYSGQC